MTRPPIPARHGLHEPLTALGTAPPASVVRLVRVDISRADADADVLVRGEGDDSVRGVDGELRTIATASVAMRIDRTSHVGSIECAPEPAGVQSLVGGSAASGFRARLVAAVPEEYAAGALVHQLLDETPVALLISYYKHKRDIEDRHLAGLPVVSLPENRRANVCAGWAVGASALTLWDEIGHSPTPIGPLTPQLDDVQLPAQETGTMRRLRMTVVTRDDIGRVAARVWFRDTFAEPDGVISTVHEYEVLAVVDLDSDRLAALEIVPHVLPWRECTLAVPSTSMLVGQPLASLRSMVRAELKGALSCTHLNDTLRTLQDVPMLAYRLTELT